MPALSLSLIHILAAGEKHYSTITYDRKAEVLTFDRTYSGVHWNIVHNRSMAVKAEEELSLRILMDRYTVEDVYKRQILTSIPYEQAGFKGKNERLTAKAKTGILRKDSSYGPS